MMDCGTILVVDHDDASRLTAVDAVVRLGYEARPSATGDDVLERLNGDRPALAIVEVELTGAVSGLELLQHLHQHFDRELPVILVSAGRTAALDRTAGFLLGADDYLVKPLDPGELMARIKRSLRRSQPRTDTNGGRPELNLSPREREILSLLAEGQTQGQIASELVISSKTVATHIQRILSKLGVHTRAQAVSSAFRLGLVEADVRGHGLDLALLVES